MNTKTIEEKKKLKKEYNKKYYRESQIYKRRTWSIREDNMVLAHDMPDKELSTLIKRSVGNIQRRRSVLKKSMRMA